jgi:hypothetical protein
MIAFAPLLLLAGTALAGALVERPHAGLSASPSTQSAGLTNGQASGPATAPSSENVVIIGIAGSIPIASDKLQQALRGAFADLGRVPVIESQVPREISEQIRWARTRGQSSQGSGVFWLESTAENAMRVRIFLSVNGESPRTYVRELDLGPDEETALESLSVVLRAQVQALATGLPSPMMQEVNVAPEPEPITTAQTPPIGEEKPPTPPPARPQWHGEVGYQGDTFAENLPWHGGAALGVGVRLLSGATLSGAIGLLVSPTTAGSPRFRIVRVPFSARFGYEWRLSRGRFGLGISGQARLEWLHWALAVPAPEVQSGVPGATWRFALGPQLGFSWNWTRSLGLCVRAGPDFWLANWTLEARYGDTKTKVELVKPYAVGAGAFAGLRYAF